MSFRIHRGRPIQSPPRLWVSALKSSGRALATHTSPQILEAIDVLSESGHVAKHAADARQRKSIRFTRHVAEVRRGRAHVTGPRHHRELSCAVVGGLSVRKAE